MLDILRFAVSCVLTLGGLFVLISGVVGVFRFPYALSRIHAAALGDTLGIALMISGVMVAEGFSVITLKLLVVMLFLWLTSPVASHLIGRMEVTINDELDVSMTVADLDAVWHEKEGD
ncbi:MAG: monovalent cation/H(+) antiporter subunit G [Christensenellaceae bacterium]|nr:monovalent cation/H(+) antiporter subunit G [Christensenellaceae bacterium]